MFLNCAQNYHTIYHLRKLKQSVGMHILILTYYGLFHSLLMYDVRLWGGCALAGRVFILKKAMRIIMGLKNGVL